MGLTKQHEALLVAALYLVTLYFWTLPIQNNPLPFGEVDAASHYAVAEYTASSDRSITTLPHYIDVYYGDDNKYQMHTLWYPPPFHTILAMAATFGNADLAIYLMNAVLCSLIVLAVYFLMRMLFNFDVAFVSATLVAFSMRDISVFLWGQWPERMGFAFLPIVLYCFFRYTHDFLDGKTQPIYLYLLSLMFAGNLFIHPMDFFHTLVAVGFAGLFLFIKEKKLFFSVKDVSFAILLFLLVIAVFPSQTRNVVAQMGGGDVNDPQAVNDWSRIFFWYKPSGENLGVPASYFSYAAMIGPAWSIIFVLVGILFLFMGFDRRSIMFLGWLVGLYLMLHLDILGMGRGHRSLSATAHLFYPLMLLGVAFVSSFVTSNQVRQSLPWIFGIIIIASTFGQVHNALKEAYLGPTRITSEQMELTAWMRSLPPETELFHVGGMNIAKTRWLSMTGHHYVAYSGLDQKKIPYVIIDASDAIAYGHKPTLDAVQQMAQKFQNATPAYLSPSQSIVVVPYGS